MSIEIEEFLQKLGIKSKGEESDNGYVVDLKNSDEFFKVYSTFDVSNLLDEAEEATTLTEENGNITFYSDDYQLTLTADFEADMYKLIIVED